MQENFKQQFCSLIPLVDSLLTSSTSSLLFLINNLSPKSRAKLIATIYRFLQNPYISPSKYYKNHGLIKNFEAAKESFERSLLYQFEGFDDKKDENGMFFVAESLWALGGGGSGSGSSVIKVFFEKREVFYDTQFNPLDNLM
ncbi:hypothetical protein BY996DRAFT_2343284 [Phakopsora pachyrhizi]|nr:hypothetical protein BY996DRAFT_2343284 [Phakopsora pachyrhizi]